MSLRRFFSRECRKHPGVVMAHWGQPFGPVACPLCVYEQRRAATDELIRKALGKKA